MLFLKWLMIWWRFSRDPEYSRVNSMLPRRLVWELQNVPEVSPRLDQRRGGLEEVGPGGQWLWSLWPFFIIFPYFSSRITCQSWPFYSGYLCNSLHRWSPGHLKISANHKLTKLTVQALQSTLCGRLIADLKKAGKKAEAGQQIGHVRTVW